MQRSGIKILKCYNVNVGFLEKKRKERKNVTKTIAIAKQKGSAAKTTTLEMAIDLASLGKKVLLVDIDNQAELTTAAGLKPMETEHSVCDILKEDALPTKECIAKVSNIENLYIIPSNIDLMVLEKELLLRPDKEKILKRALAQVENDFDFVLIDCPQKLCNLSVNGFTAAHYVLFPMREDFWQEAVCHNMLLQSKRPKNPLIRLLRSFFDLLGL